MSPSYLKRTATIKKRKKATKRDADGCNTAVASETITFLLFVVIDFDIRTIAQILKGIAAMILNISYMRKAISQSAGTK
jgi:hypothetical protein